MRIFNILQVAQLEMSCLKVKFGGVENLFDVLTQYKILGFCRLGFNRRELYSNYF
jgi:hypothetical protein